MPIQFVPLTQKPELSQKLFPKDLSNSWPPYMLEYPTSDLFYGDGRLERYEAFTLVAFDSDSPNVLLGRGFSVPFRLDDSLGRTELPDGGWDAVVQWADDDQICKREPNAVSALEITLHSRLQGRGLSSKMLTAMKENAKRLGFKDLYAPVRPNRKHLEPELSMTNYAYRVREDGLPFDPWLRVHARIGGEIVKIAPCSMVISGSLVSWRKWTGLAFERSGPCIVPRALAPVHVSTEHDHAVYVEANVWVRHEL